MFISTILLSIHALVYTSSLERNAIHPYIVVVCQFVDNFINNVVMYYTLFCGARADHTGDDSEFQSRMDFMIQQRSQMVGDDMITHLGDEPSSDALVWVSLPGLHPIRVTKSIVYEYHLDEDVVTDSKFLKQIERYEQRGFISSLMSCCRSPHDFEAAIDLQTPQELAGLGTITVVYPEADPEGQKDAAYE